MNSFFKKRFHSYTPLEPDEVLLDAGNVPKFDETQMEGVLERPLGREVFILFSIVFFIVFALLSYRAFALQVKDGEAYKFLSESNRLRHEVVFAKRGVIYDRNGVELAWNAASSTRSYIHDPSLAHLVGYTSLPLKSEIEKGVHPREYVGRTGVEYIYDTILRGSFGSKIVEEDVRGNVLSESTIEIPRDGNNITLSVDSRLQSALYRYIADVAQERGFDGGSGVIIDVHTGEIIAATNYPSFDLNDIVSFRDSQKVQRLQSDQRKPFLNRLAQGLYTPGSIFKLFVAFAALNEGVVTPEKVIFTNGSLRVPSPFDPNQATIFHDWKNHGPVNLYDAIAMSSNVYFFKVGGGFRDQKGVGIKKIIEYANLFGLGSKTGSDFPNEAEGLVPSPSWKKKLFGEEWLLGDTYNTAIGQYNVLVTPLQVVRAVAAIANSGVLVEPTVIKGEEKHKIVLKSISQEYFRAVQKGMRAAVERGTAQGLSLPFVRVAAKTGTAEIDFGKRYVNSWVTGFFPYDTPRYAFVVVMEKGPRDNYIGGVFVMRRLFEWMQENAPEYFATSD